MSQVFFDTNLFVYWFEDPTGRGIEVGRLIRRMVLRGDQVVTSTFTLGELLVMPLETGDVELARKYESVMNSPGVRLLHFDSNAAKCYARIRQDRSIKAPDAIQLACASAAGCDLFMTNDNSLTRKNIAGIQFIVTLERSPI